MKRQASAVALSLHGQLHEAIVVPDSGTNRQDVAKKVVQHSVAPYTVRILGLRVERKDPAVAPGGRCGF
jgi:hypothetical protein